MGVNAPVVGNAVVVRTPGTVVPVASLKIAPFMLIAFPPDMYWA